MPLLIFNTYVSLFRTQRKFEIKNTFYISSDNHKWQDLEEKYCGCKYVTIQNAVFRES